MTNLYTVILAAGGSTRLGQPKQLLKKHGEPLLLRSLRIAHEVTPGRVVVVLGAQRVRLRLMLRRWSGPATVVVDNGHWREGMAGSLNRGLRAVPQHCDAALLMLVDQPGITPASLHRLARIARQHPSQLVAAYYSDRPGVPAIIPRRYWRELMGLKGDQGARQLLRARQADLTTVCLPEADWDIDQPADLLTL